MLAPQIDGGVASRYSATPNMTFIEYTQRLIDNRREPEQWFDSELFADSAWEIMLDLFVACVKGKKISVSGVSAGTTIPPTTTLRWIANLTECGLLERSGDSFDRRRVHIGLSANAFENMKTYLERIATRSGFALRGVLDPSII